MGTAAARRRWHCGLLVSAWFVVATPLASEAQEKHIFRAPQDDLELEQAREIAQKRLAEFLAAALPPVPGTSDHAVKIGVRDGTLIERMWIRRIERVGAKRFVGILDNTPVDILTYKKGDQIEFREAEVVDWYFSEDDKGRGGFQTCVLARRAGPKVLADLKESLGLECE